MFHAEDYVIVANITNDPFSESPYGQLHVQEDYRSLVYTIPAIAAAGLMILGAVPIACVFTCYHVAHGRKRKGELLINPIAETSDGS
jgi:hypothetical protein